MSITKRTRCPKARSRSSPTSRCGLRRAHLRGRRRAAAGAAAGQQCRALCLGRFRRVQRRASSTRTWRSTSARRLLLIERFAAAHDGEATRWSSTCSIRSSPRRTPTILSYTLSKQALAGLTELAARALAPQAIRVNGIAPALMLRSSGQSEENFEAMHATNPLRRGVEADDVVAALRYLDRAPRGDRPDAHHRFRAALPGARARRPVPGDAMSDDAPKLDGLVPDHLKVRSARILLEVARGPGRHRLSRFRGRSAAAAAGHGRDLARRSSSPPADDDPAGRGTMISCAPRSQELAGARRYNLQETLAHAIFERVAAFRGVRALRVRMSKPDVYAEPQASASKSLRFRALAGRLNGCVTARVSGLPAVEQNPLRGL